MTETLLDLACCLAPKQGYNATGLAGVRLLRSETVLEDVPVLYRPGVVFVLQGAKQGVLGGDVYRYDADHYLAVSVPVPFRMGSVASPERPLLAVYVDFDLRLAADIAVRLCVLKGDRAARAKSLVSSPMEPMMTDTLTRMLVALSNPEELAVLGPGLLRELHYRVLVGPQGGALTAAIRQEGTSGKIVRSLAVLRERYAERLSVAALAREAGMSVPSYHMHFKALTGSTPIQYIKAMRLHEARLMIARREGTVSASCRAGRLCQRRAVQPRLPAPFPSQRDGRGRMDAGAYRRG